MKYIIQMFDDRKDVLAWDNGVVSPINTMKEAQAELSRHVRDWPNCKFRVATYIKP